MKIYTVILLMLAFACSSPSTRIVNPNDYQSLLTTSRVEFVSTDKTIEFWQTRLGINPNDLTATLQLASLHASRFKSFGTIDDLHLSDSLFHVALAQTPFGKASIYQSLAANAITQHQFKQANDYLELALESGEDKATTHLMLADVRMELGDIGGAKNILKDIKNKNAFAFLIRQAKIDDKEGHLDSAIMRMEQGLERIGTSNTSLYCWTKSNLGDMYGHAGRIGDAYQSYLDVLHADPTYVYALKGIAWIALSHDRNCKEAKRILHTIKSQKNAPELNLMLAEIAELEQDVTTKRNLEQQFITEVGHSGFGVMYNRHIALLEAEVSPELAVEIAKEEVRNRPTIESYDLLAWSLYKSGNVKDALEIARTKIEGKTSEPEVMYHLGIMYSQVNRKKSVGYLQQANESAFELGPLASAHVDSLLDSINTF